MATLYDLTDQFKQLYELLAAGDIDEDTVNDTLAAMDFSGEFEAKADGYARVIRMFEYDAEAAQYEAARLADRKRMFDGRAKLLKQKLFDAMKATGKEKFKTPAFTFGIRNNPVTLNIINEGAIPDGYVHTVERKEIDKAVIKEALKSGQEVAGCQLIQGQSLQIR